jgi:hypothetical protein
MRLLAALAFAFLPLAFVPLGARPAVALFDFLEATSGNQVGAATSVTSSAISIAAGNTVIVVAGANVDEANSITNSGTALTWTACGITGAYTPDIGIWHADATTTESITATSTGASVAAREIIVAEFEGSTDTVDFSSAFAGTGTAIDSGAATATASALAVGLLTSQFAPTWEGTWTARVSYDFQFRLFLASKTVAAGDYNAQATQATGNWGAVICIVQAPGGAPSFVPAILNNPTRGGAHAQRRLLL